MRAAYHRRDLSAIHYDTAIYVCFWIVLEGKSISRKNYYRNYTWGSQWKRSELKIRGIQSLSDSRAISEYPLCILPNRFNR